MTWELKDLGSNVKVHEVYVALEKCRAGLTLKLTSKWDGFPQVCFSHQGNAIP